MRVYTLESPLAIKGYLPESKNRFIAEVKAILDAYGIRCIGTGQNDEGFSFFLINGAPSQIARMTTNGLKGGWKLNEV
jgi:hypothetical protein